MMKNHTAFFIPPPSPRLVPLPSGDIFVYNIAFLLYNYGKELEGRHYQCSKLRIGAKENWR